MFVFWEHEKHEYTDKIELLVFWEHEKFDKQGQNKVFLSGNIKSMFTIDNIYVFVFWDHEKHGKHLQISVVCVLEA